ALVTALAVVGLVLAASWIFLRVWGPSLTSEEVESLLSAALGQPVHLGAVRLQPWRLRASLVDLDVPASTTSPAALRVRAASIDVGLDIASVWRRRITLSALATDLDLEMTVPDTPSTGPGLFPLPEFFQAGPLRVGIGSVRVTRGHVVIHQKEPALTFE